MDRLRLQEVAKRKLADVEALLGAGRWSAAYYHCGYVIECGLKACVLRYIGESAAVFGDDKYLKKLIDCWTHDLGKLAHLAGLDAEFGVARGANPNLDGCWSITKDWNESTRYEEKTEVEAKRLYEAISNTPDGVFPWMQSRW